MKEVILTIDDLDKALIVFKKELENRKIYKWKMKNGNLIDVKDMSDTHLQNTISLLEEQKLLYEI